jgi:hypothetical protein
MMNAGRVARLPPGACGARVPILLYDVPAEAEEPDAWTVTSEGLSKG